MTELVNSVIAANAAARAAQGFALSLVVARLARVAGALAPSGVLAAVMVGTAATAAGWSWTGVLVVYFVAAALLSRLGRDAKHTRSMAVVEKDGPRDAWQVLANGGVFATVALAHAAFAAPWLPAAALGALAASAADTWATEIGILKGGPTRSIIRRTAVRTGQSGGVTTAGTAASVAGAAFVGGVGLVAGFSSGAALAAMGGGIAGAFADSIIGELLQESRTCEICGTPTERTVHDCGAPTVHAHGIGWLRNDLVNLLATIVGALTGILIWLSVPSAR